MMVVMMMNIHLEAQDERINDSSTSAAKVMVKYEEVDGGRSGAVGKSVKKLSKSRQKSQKIVKEPKKLQGLKNLQRTSVRKNVYQIPILCQLDTRNSNFHQSSVSFSSSFARLKSFLDITFGAITEMAKLVELLMLCCVFPLKSEEDLRVENTRVFHQP